MMIGLTHSKEGLPIIIEDKAVKVGIGLPRGKAVDVWVDTSGEWNIRQGNAVSGKLAFKTVAKVKTRAEAESEFRKAYEAADLCAYPRKIPYFSFSRSVIGKDGTESYIPDFDAIEAYSFADPKRPGPPTEIDIVFLSTDPFQGQFAYWSSSELRCSGDGVDANRSVLMYDDEKKVPESMREAWKVAKAAGQRTFVVSNECWSCECPFSKEKDGKPSPCKPSGDLRFQLLRNPKPGGTAFFHTSGYRSIRQLFSAVESIKELTGGRIYGIPLKMVVKSHITNHANQRAIQQNVTLRPRDEDKLVWNKLIERAWQKYMSSDVTSLPEPTKMLEPASQDFEDSPMSAQAMAGEFYPDNDETEDTPPPTTNSPATQAASAAKVQEIGEKLAATQQATAPAPASNVVSIAPEKAPWTDAEKPRVKMTEIFQALLKEIGKPVYDGLLKKHGLDTGATIKHDAPEVLACYKEMVVAREAAKQTATQQTASQQAPATDERPLF
jgi:predicted Zn-ribbon and HTH transcriptional regulator